MAVLGRLEGSARCAATMTMFLLTVLSTAISDIVNAQGSTVTTPPDRSVFPPPFGGKEIVDWCSLPQDGTTPIQMNLGLGGIFKVENQVAGDVLTISNCDKRIFAYIVDVVNGNEADKYVEIPLTEDSDEVAKQGWVDGLFLCIVYFFCQITIISFHLANF